MKELEARLAQVETQLVSEMEKLAATTAATETDVNTNAITDPDWGAPNLNMSMNMNMNIDMDLDMDMGMSMNFTNEGLHDLGYDTTNENLGNGSSVPMGDLFSQEIISLGLQEPLPPESLMDDLYVLILGQENIHVLIKQADTEYISKGFMLPYL